MFARVIVCSGCCCGNLEKGHDEVPVEYLREIWAERGIHQDVQLTISDCLGPCNMRNIAVLKTERGLTWLGGLSEIDHYKSIVNWASKYSKNQKEGKLTDELQQLEFNHDKDLDFIDD